MFTVSARRKAGPGPAALLADSETENAPAVVGVPLITPLDGLSDNPPGRPGAANAVGELLAVTA